MAVRKLIVELIGDDGSLQRAFGRTSRGAKNVQRDLSAMERGVAAGSGAFKGLGRSIAFASGGFLAFSGATAFLRKSVDAALEAQVANRQLATQLRNNGKVFAQYRGEIDHTVNRLSALSGIQNDELKQGLTTILRTVPDVGKALRDLSTAADLARARHLSLGQAALIIAKTEAGNTTLLRRQGFQIAKNATAEQALAKLRQVVAGQAAAGTTAQERFGAVLHETEEIIGTGLLPTINRYLESGSKWLQQMNESGDLQRNVATAAKEFGSAVDDVSTVVRDVDKVTGSFKNTLELLLGLKVASVLGSWVGSFKTLNATAGESVIASSKLLTNLSKLGRLGPIGLTIAIAIQDVQDPHSILDRLDFLRKLDKSKLDALKAIPGAGPGLGFLIDLSNVGTHHRAAPAPNTSGMSNDPLHDAADRQRAAATDAQVRRRLSELRAQRNRMAQLRIDEVLTRSGLGSLATQLAGVRQAERLTANLRNLVKDATFRRKLYTDLLQLRKQEHDLVQQIAANARQARQATFDDLLGGLQLNLQRAQATSKVTDDIAALEAINAGLRREAKALGNTVEIQSEILSNTQQIAELRKQQESDRLFGILGLGPGGEDKVPNVAKLKGEVRSLSKQIAGTVFDTIANERKLTQLRKLVTDRALPGHPEVRQKAQDMIDAFADGLKRGAQLPRFKHATADALLKGLDIDPRLKRILRARLAQVGPGGSVPGGQSLAFSGAGAGKDVTVHSNVYLDGRQVTRSVTRGQQKDSTRRTQSRRGPYAGRH